MPADEKILWKNNNNKQTTILLFPAEYQYALKINASTKHLTEGNLELLQIYIIWHNVFGITLIGIGMN